MDILGRGQVAVIGEWREDLGALETEGARLQAERILYRKGCVGASMVK